MFVELLCTRICVFSRGWFLGSFVLLIFFFSYSLNINHVTIFIPYQVFILFVYIRNNCQLRMKYDDDPLSHKTTLDAQ